MSTRVRDHKAEYLKRKNRKAGGTVPKQETTEAPRRGRPRPAEVIERDEQVFNAVSDTPKSTQELVDVVEAPKNAVYASLFRLRRDGRVRRATDESGSSLRAWVRA